MPDSDISIEGEIRRDFLGRMAILSPSRALRPHDFKAEPPQKKQNPKDCFFCPGNENLTPPEIDRTLLKDGKGWQNRVFCNKFPATNFAWKNAYGTHEVIVETPKHELTLSQLSDSEIGAYLLMVAKRLRAHAKDSKIKYTSVFKNEWEAAGASLEHTHTQLVGLPFVPDYIKLQYKACKGDCPFCLMPIDGKYPKVISKGDYLLLAPYVPKYNHEMWIVPKRHAGSLADLSDEEIFSLAKVLGSALRTQDSYLNYPPYNILYHISPHRSKGFHMHISITPRIAKWAGFELATNVIMNSVRPEVSAQEYRLNLK